MRFARALAQAAFWVVFPATTASQGLRVHVWWLLTSSPTSPEREYFSRLSHVSLSPYFSIRMRTCHISGRTS